MGLVISVKKISTAIVSPAHCTPIAPSPPIPFAANAAVTAWSLLLHNVIGDRMIPFAANALQCIVNGKKTSKTACFPLDFITLPEENWATAIGNTHGKIDKDRACSSGDMPADTQTHRQTHRRRLLIKILRHRSRGRSNYLRLIKGVKVWPTFFTLCSDSDVIREHRVAHIMDSNELNIHTTGRLRTRTWRQTSKGHRNSVDTCTHIDCIVLFFCLVCF